MRNSTLTFLAALLLLAPSAMAQEPRADVYDLAQCLEIAERSNHDVRIAREEVERQKATLRSVRGNLFPELTAEGSYVRTAPERVPEMNGNRFGSEVQWDGNVKLSQSIYGGGRLTASLEREQLLLDAAQLQLRATVNRVAADVRERYYAVLLARDSVGVREELVRLREASLRSERDKLNAGTVSRFNVIRAEVALANSQPPLIRARNEYRVARQDLRRVIGGGTDETKDMDVEGSLRYDPASITLPEALETARRLRPDLGRLELMIQAADRGVEIERANYHPSLSAFGGYGIQNSPFSDRASDSLEGWQAGVQAEWKIFDSFRTKGAVDAAQRGKEIARITREQALEAVNIEVRRAFSSLQEARELVDASKKVVEQAQESLRLAEARFDVGAATQLDVLESQVSLTEARTNDINALYNYSVALTQLRRAMGVFGNGPTD